MSKIILLNGAGSSGKTSIASSIQYISDEIWLSFGIDTFIEMTPYPAGDQKKTEYFSFNNGKNEHGPTVRVEAGPKSHQLFGIMPRFAQLLASEGNNLIIDEVLLDDEILENYVSTLKNYQVYYVGVYCALSVMQEREILRRDRAIGLSNDQYDRVHQGKRDNYDFRVDTSRISSFDAAREILDFVSKNPAPGKFSNKFLNSKLLIKNMTEDDISIIVNSFTKNNWEKPASIFINYLNEQKNKQRSIWLASYNGEFAGYITLKWHSLYAPFKEKNIPEIMDLNVLPPYRNKGIGNLLLDHAEQEVFAKNYTEVGIGVGLYKDYGNAQKIYIKRGYQPDGQGVTYDYKFVEPGNMICLDDNLVLWFTKKLR